MVASTIIPKIDITYTNFQIGINIIHFVGTNFILEIISNINCNLNTCKYMDENSQFL